MVKKWVLVFACAAFSSVSMAHHVSEHKYDDILLTKGHARLNILVSGPSVEIELYTPTVNMVSFEGGPGSEKQQAEFDAATTWLADINNLFKFDDAAECVAVVAEINTVNIGESDKADNAKLAEFDAYYVLECTKPEERNKVTVNLFDGYVTHKEIFTKRQGVGKTKYVKLTPEKNVMELK
jgi:hypothetical protein